VLVVGCHFTAAATDRDVGSCADYGAESDPDFISAVEMSIYHRTERVAFYRQVTFSVLPRDARRKRGLCCRPVPVRHVGVVYPDG